MQLPAQSTGSSPWGHVTVIVFILTQGDTQQQRTLCVALTGAATSLQGGDREKLWVSWVHPAVDQGRLTHSVRVEVASLCGSDWSSPCVLSVTSLPQTAQSFPLFRANKLWDSGTPALWSRPLAQQYTQHVVRDTYWRSQVHSLGTPGTGTAKPLWILFSSLCVVIVEEDPILLTSAVRGSRGLGSPGGLMQPDIFWPCFYTLNGDVED